MLRAEQWEWEFLEDIDYNINTILIIDYRYCCLCSSNTYFIINSNIQFNIQNYVCVTGQ